MRISHASIPLFFKSTCYGIRKAFIKLFLVYFQYGFAVRWHEPFIDTIIFFYINVGTHSLRLHLIVKSCVYIVYIVINLCRELVANLSGFSA